LLVEQEQKAEATLRLNSITRQRSQPLGLTTDKRRRLGKRSANQMVA
jgi:hypothetical protein